MIKIPMITRFIVSKITENFLVQPAQASAMEVVLMQIATRMKSSNLELVTMSKQIYRNLFSCGLKKATTGTAFKTKIFVSIIFFYPCVRRKFFPSFCVSRLKAEMTTPTKRFIIKNAPISTNVAKKRLNHGCSLQPGTKYGPLLLMVWYMRTGQLTNQAITII